MEMFFSPGMSLPFRMSFLSVIAFEANLLSDAVPFLALSEAGLLPENAGVLSVLEANLLSGFISSWKLVCRQKMSGVFVCWKPICFEKLSGFFPCWKHVYSEKVSGFCRSAAREYRVSFYNGSQSTVSFCPNPMSYVSCSTTA